jgi:VIT1/CCC1 family predicted Fe2+/Mn2+ transporter
MTHKTITKFDLEKHLAEEHKMTGISTYLKEIVYGGNDGIVTTFAVVAGFAGAQAQGAMALPALTVLLFGFANLFADGVSMALGNFLSTRSEQDVYTNIKAKEAHEISVNPDIEKAESIEILMRKGFDESQATKIVELYMQNTSYWTDFMMTQELELPNPEGENPFHMALATFVSFIIFGFIPLVPYVFLAGHPSLFLVSSFATGGALALLGVLRWKVTMQSFWRSVSETLILGGAAAVVAYLVGTLFRI